MSRKRWYILVNPATKQREHLELTDRALGERIAAGWAILQVPERRTTTLNTEGLPHKASRAEVAAVTGRGIARNREVLTELADK